MKKNIKLLFGLLITFALMILVTSCDNQTISVTWTNEDGTIIKEVTVSSLEGLEYDGANPVKASNAEYTYTFDGWQKKENEDGSVSYMPIFKATKNKYNITFKNEDGTILKTLSLEYGTIASNIERPEEPTKEGNTEFSYQFAGWDKDIAQVTGDATYTATYTTVKNKYNVTFVDEDGTTVLKAAKEYEYGTLSADIEKPADPTKESSAEFTYTFNGWDKEVSNVTGDVTYKAVYTATKNKYTVTFVDEDGTVLKAAKEYEYGTLASNIEKPENPTKQSTAQYVYSFNGWDKTVENVTGNVVYKATFKANDRLYSVKFVNDDGTVLVNYSYTYYTSPLNLHRPLTTPTKEANAEYTYTFAGWDKELDYVTEDTVYTATYTATKNKYSILFVDENDSVLLEAKAYDYGTLASDIEKPVAPTKQNTQEYTYEFAGWDTEVSTVTANVTYKATYKATKNKYTVTFVNYDGAELSKTAYEYGTKASDIVLPENPTKLSDPKYSYEFTSWGNGVTDVTKDVVYKASYVGSLNKYKITYLNDDGSLLSERLWNYGSSAESLVNNQPTATKEPTKQYTYTFAGWDKEIVDVTEAATYTATYTATLNKYIVKFVDEDGKSILKEAIAYDYGTPAADVETPTDPTKAKTQAYTYEFAGWDKVISNVTDDITYKATYKATLNKYTVTFLNYDGTVLLEAKAYDYGTDLVDIELPENPTKPRTQQFTYVFGGYDKEVTTVTEDVVYTAVYDAMTNQYTVKFVDEDGKTVLKEAIAYDYGTKASSIATPDPTKARTQAYTYTFAGWDKEIVDVTDDVIYKATYSATINKYNVTFVNEDGSELSKIAYDYGTKASSIATPDPTKARTQAYTYTFAGWDNELSDVTDDVIYKATYSATINKYNVTFVNEDGSELSKIAYDYGTKASEIVEPSTPTKESDPEFDYSFKAWDKEFETVTDDQVYTATYNGILKIYKASLETNMTEACELTEINSTYTVHDNINLKAKLTKGYTFVGWFINGKNVSQDLEYEYEMPTTDIEVVATFEYFTVTAKTTEDGMIGHYVTYDYNYDKGPADEVVFVKAGDSLPDKFASKSSSVFRGWFLDEECTKVLPNEYEITEDITLYAGWYDYYSSQYPTIISPLASDSTTTEAYKGGAGTQYSSYRYFYYVAPADGTVTFVITSYQCSATIRNSTQNKNYYGGYKYSPFDQDMTYADKTKQIPVNKGDVLYFHFGRIDNKTSFSLKFYLTTLPVEARNITCSSADNTKVTVGENVTFSAAPNDGYTFMGWYDGETLVSTDSQYTFEMTRENVNLVAKYDTARVLAESSNTNLGTVSMPAKTYLGAKVKLQASTIASGKGGAYLGWYDEDDNLLSTSRTLEVEVTKDVKKYIAKYDTIRVRATTPDTTIGTVSNPSDQQYIGEEASLYVNTRNTNYAFAGWYLNGELVTTECNFKPIVTKDIVTYEARFGELKIKLTSNLEGTTQTTEAQYMGYNVQISTSYVENTTFLGWYNGDELVATGTYTKVIVPIEPITLTAKYIEGYTVKAVADVEGAVITMPKSGSVGFGEEIRVTGVDGYTFMGWYCDGERIAKADYFKAYPTEEVKTYVAHFDTPRVVVTVNDENAGTATVDERVKALCNQFTYIEATAKTGYKFVGWYLNGELVETNARTAIYMSDDVVTYEARFEKIETE